ncbi:MAG: sel1 repeat family protein [Acidobacteria bacterium]|nr:sel1 repeat family protein [Acidobacteriota bacterium]
MSSGSRRAESTGHARAQAKLGLLYLSGRGVPRDTALAHLWYLRAAEAGDDEGMAGLAVVHVQSDFDGRDPIEAMKWALLAARRSNAFAERLIEREFATLSPEERALAKTRADAWERARAMDLPHGDRER